MSAMRKFLRADAPKNQKKWDHYNSFVNSINQEIISLSHFKINLEGHQNLTLDRQNLKSYMW